jgi:signal transduction histidine kinase
MVAHDIKGLLGTILGYAELISNRAEQAALPMLREWGGEQTEAVLKIGRIVEALLLLARVRQKEVVLVNLEMCGIVAEAKKRLEKQIASAQAQIEMSDGWPRSRGYAPWIEEVWINYLSNAIRYGGQPPRIELGAELLTNPKTGAAEVRFWVRDNGRGLTPEQQARLFVEFERLGRVGRAGQGLGLSIVKRIVEKLGGQVGVQSKPGQGSEFFFTLPAAE